MSGPLKRHSVTRCSCNQIDATLIRSAVTKGCIIISTARRKLCVADYRAHARISPATAAGRIE